MRVATQNQAASRPYRTPELTHIRELDGVRGLAALLVFFHHAFVAPGHWNRLTTATIGVAQYGNTGVDLFFILSGFLITSLLYRDRESSVYWHDFYWKRALRILPLYLVAIGIAAVLGTHWKYLLLCVFFVANFSNVFHMVAAGPFWSLAIEEQFYLLWPMLVRRVTLQRLRSTAVVVGVAASLLRVGFAYFGHHNYALTFLRCDGLAFGAVLACMFASEQDKRVDDRPPIQDTRRLLTWVLISGACLFVSARMFLETWERGLFFAPASQTAIVLVTGALVGLVIWNRGSRWLAPLRGRFLTFFGLISYAFYMLHAYTFDLYDHLVSAPVTGAAGLLWRRVFAVLLLSVLFSVLSRYLVELPAMSLRRFVLRRPAPSPRQQHVPLPLANL